MSKSIEIYDSYKTQYDALLDQAIQGDISSSEFRIKADRLSNQVKKYLDAAAASLCPCPPETSPLEVGGGISARHMLLSESVTGGLSVTGDFLLSDLDELLKDFFPVNGSAVPFNLE